MVRRAWLLALLAVGSTAFGQRFIRHIAETLDALK